MAYLLGLEKASLSFALKCVLDKVSLGVEDGDRIGIVGRNGDGKTSLIRVLAGKIQPDSGRCIPVNNLRIGLVTQDDTLCGESCVRDVLFGTRPLYEWAKDTRARDVMGGLLRDIHPQALLKNLSGGQRRRVNLARVLMQSWDVLILDEPTNHLDMAGIRWLAFHLKQRFKQQKGALLVVTHDRWFLDDVCTRMWEVHDGRVEPFEGGFSAYILQRVERERVRDVTWERQQNKLRRELAWLARGARARATKPKFHVAQAKALAGAQAPERSSLTLNRMAATRLGKEVISFQGLSVSYPAPSPHTPPHTVLNDITWSIGPGDRIGIVGDNGCGKTTLLQTMQIQHEHIPSALASATISGKVKIGKTVKRAFLSQHLSMLTPFEDECVRAVISRYSRRIMLDGVAKTPSDLLMDLGFEQSIVQKRIGSLSGGEKRRLALMLILLDEPNVIILDEPGNDLDVDMLAALEDMLNGWPGTLVVVTHDRYLMARTTDNQYVLSEGSLIHLAGGVEAYFDALDVREVSDDALCALWFSAPGTRDWEQAAGIGTRDGAREALGLGAGGQRGGASSGAAGAGARGVNGANGANGMRSSHGETPDGSAAASNSADAKPAAAKPAVSHYQLKKQCASLERKMATAHKKIDALRLEMHAVAPSDFEALGKLQVQLDERLAELNSLEDEWLVLSEQLEG